MDALDDKATVVAQPAGLWLPPKARVTTLGSSEVNCKANLPRVPPSHKTQWIRLFDPRRSEEHLRAEAKQALVFRMTGFAACDSAQCCTATQPLTHGQTAT